MPALPSIKVLEIKEVSLNGNTSYCRRTRFVSGPEHRGEVCNLKAFKSEFGDVSGILYSCNLLFTDVIKLLPDIFKKLFLIMHSSLRVRLYLYY